MPYEKGLYLSRNTGDQRDEQQYIIVDGTQGITRFQKALAQYAQYPGKTTFVMYPQKTSPDVGVNENASKFMELCQEAGESNIISGHPLVVDIYKAETGRFGFDDVRALGRYFKNNFVPRLTNLPLLRLNLATWRGWYANNPNECASLLADFELLIVQVGMDIPSIVDGVEARPAWWEYDYANGRIAYDKTRAWADSPVKPTPPPPGEDDPGDEEDPVPATEYTVDIVTKFLGFKIHSTGTMKAVT